MAHLLRKPRRNPDTGHTETYFQIQHPGRKVLTLGYVTEEEAGDALILYRAALIRERRGESDPLASMLSAMGYSRPVEEPERAPVPLVREWWGESLDPWPRWPECGMLTWLSARGVRGKALRNWDESRRRLVREVGHLRLDQLGRAEIDAFTARLRADGYSDRTVQIRVGHLLGGLKAALEHGHLASVPTVPRPRLRVSKDRVWATPDQAIALVEALRVRAEDGRLSRASHAAILVELTLGLRPGEIRTRRWEHLDRASATLRVCPVELPDGTTWVPKGARSRTVQVPDNLLSMLAEEHLRRGRMDGWMFPSPRKADWPLGSFRKALGSACVETGLPDVLHPHALRHTAATALAWQGASLRDLMDHCGWSTEAMAKIYLHSNTDRLRELVSAAEPLPAPRTPVQGAEGTRPTKPPTTTGYAPRKGPELIIATKKKPALRAG